MRSRLEASYAQHLDEQELTWEYEPNCFAGDTGQYLPDFRITTYPRAALGAHLRPPARRRLYVEVKPVLTLDVARDVATRMQIILSSEPDAQLEMWSPDLSLRGGGVDGRWRSDGHPPVGQRWAVVDLDTGLVTISAYWADQ
jgi:hypothetical protein